jgi:SAM-dependent methyltransferase
MISSTLHDSRKLLARIIESYDLPIIRAYCKIRFNIVNINILHILALCLRGKRRVLDVGCGFGLFGCYFSALYPEITYRGYDIDSSRIDIARQAASQLGLGNVMFYCQDARQLRFDDQCDAIMIVDLLHHIDNDSKHSLLATCGQHLAHDGRLIIKDVTTRPFLKLAFTWVLDMLMTRGFEMWYWDEKQFQAALGKHFNRVDTFPIADWVPYPHIVYLCENIPSDL